MPTWGSHTEALSGIDLVSPGAASWSAQSEIGFWITIRNAFGLRSENDGGGSIDNDQKEKATIVAIPQGTVASVVRELLKGLGIGKLVCGGRLPNSDSMLARSATHSRHNTRCSDKCCLTNICHTYTTLVNT